MCSIVGRLLKSKAAEGAVNSETAATPPSGASCVLPCSTRGVGFERDGETPFTACKFHHTVKPQLVEHKQHLAL